MVGPNMLAECTESMLAGDGSDPTSVSREKVVRKSVDEELAEFAGQLIRGLQLERHDAGQVVDRILHFFVGWAIAGQQLDFTQRLLDRLGGHFTGYRGRDDEGSGTAAKRELTAHAVCEPVFFPEAHVQTAGECSAQDGIDYLQREVIGIGAGRTGVTEAYF